MLLFFNQFSVVAFWQEKRGSALLCFALFNWGLGEVFPAPFVSWKNICKRKEVYKRQVVYMLNPKKVPLRLALLCSALLYVIGGMSK